ncbi:MAG: prokaryotic E2 ligase family D protein, partial [Lachnospiraceae bacterium]|nr:prokaryotic E2 ligase family D protein [Lachnospiraceae bacterium]
MYTVFRIDSGEAGIVTCEIGDTDGKVSRKKIKLEDFYGIVKASSGILSQQEWTYYFNPPGTFSGLRQTRGLVIGAGNGSDMRAVFFIPADKQVLNYVGTSYIVPFPSLLFYFESKNGHLSHTYVFAAKIKNCTELETGTQLYAFPFGNVDAHGGRVCWGDTKHPRIQGISCFQSIISSFFGSEVNDDYYKAGYHVIRKKEFEMQRGLLIHLAGLDGGFPDDYLVESGAGTFRKIEEKFYF